jgi:hypothetical protein
LFCDETFSRPLGKPQNKKQKTILPINSINTVIHYTSTTATSRLPKSVVHRFRAPFLCSFLLEMQKKGGKNFPVKSVISFLFFFLKQRKEGKPPLVVKHIILFFFLKKRKEAKENSRL